MSKIQIRIEADGKLDRAAVQNLVQSIQAAGGKITVAAVSVDGEEYNLNQPSDFHRGPAQAAGVKATGERLPGVEVSRPGAPTSDGSAPSGGYEER